jgi:hypothetical protein
MSDLFQSYEQDYSRLVNVISKKTENIGFQSKGNLRDNRLLEKKEAAINEAEDEMQEA